MWANGQDKLSSFDMSVQEQMSGWDSCGPQKFQDRSASQHSYKCEWLPGIQVSLTTAIAGQGLTTKAAQFCLVSLWPERVMLMVPCPPASLIFQTGAGGVIKADGAWHWFACCDQQLTF